MNLFWILVFLGIGLLACAVVVWLFRRSALFGRHEDYETREQALLAQVGADLGHKVANDLKEFEEPALAKGEQAHPPKNRHLPRPILDEQAQKIHAALKYNLGPYPLFVNVDIACLIEQEDVIPPRVNVDFVVCRKDFTPVVAILLQRRKADPLHDRAMILLNRNKIRVLRWDAAAPLDQETIRSQIFKPKKQTETPQDNSAETRDVA